MKKVTIIELPITGQFTNCGYVGGMFVYVGQELWLHADGLFSYLNYKSVGFSLPNIAVKKSNRVAKKG